jgi:hypothetical protein
MIQCAFVKIYRLTFYDVWLVLSPYLAPCIGAVVSDRSQLIDDSDTQEIFPLPVLAMSRW